MPELTDALCLIGLDNSIIALKQKFGYAKNETVLRVVGNLRLCQPDFFELGRDVFLFKQPDKPRGEADRLAVDPDGKTGGSTE